MKPRWLIVVTLAGLLVFVPCALLQFAAPVVGAPKDGAPAARFAAYLDVVINEVAWMGTDANPNHEWIELYNTTGNEIDLHTWIVNDSNGLLVSLTGTLPAHGYYLLAQSTLVFTGTEPQIDQLFSGNLRNGGEVLTLTCGATVVDTANIERGYNNGWSKGSNTIPKRTMERINPLAPDSDGNWAGNDGVIRNGHDAGGNPINGTPRRPNSATSANLGIIKSAPTEVQAHQLITYTLSFSNAGGLAASGVLITDMLPASASLVAQTSPFAFAQDGQMLAWQVGAMAVSSGTLNLTVVVSPDAGLTGWLTNTAVITSSVVDYSPDNNTSAAATLLTAAGPSPVKAKPLVLVSAVHYYGYDGANDEAIQLTNVGTQTVSIAGWRLIEDSTGVTLPAFDLAPGQPVWAAKSATSFESMFGEWPQFAVTIAGTALPLGGTWPGLANDSGGDMRLLDNLGALADRMVYGPVPAQGNGWIGAPVTPYTPTSAFAREGQILYRKLDEATGLPHDTDTSADWAQDRADPITGRRVRYPGWALETFSRTTQITQTAWLTIGIAPDHAFQVVSQVIASAQQTLTIQVYSFENAALAELLAARARAGVSVTLLLEGEPAGGLGDQAKWACAQVEPAGACWFMHNDSVHKIYDRYSNQHAKVIVADDRLVAISSENLSPRSLPYDDKSDGTVGQRGVVIVTDAPGVAEYARRLWAADFAPARHRDLIRWSAGDPDYGAPPIGFQPITVTGGVTYTVRFSQPLVLSGTFPFELIQSPENSLRQSDGLLGLIRRAGRGDEISIEQLQEPPHWGPASGTPDGDPNVFLETAIAAAARGARVRFLLDAYMDDGDNAATVAYIASLRATSDTLRANLEAHTGNPTALGIHSKMVLASIGGQGYVHAGSLNHGELAFKGNREVAIQFQSNDAYAYLLRVFWTDWNVSRPIFLPLVLRDHTAPDHLLISEVYYSGGASDEWVELYNPTGQAVDLSAFKLGDAEAPTQFEGMYQFPAGTTIQPGQVIVIAYDGSLVPQADYEIFNASAKPDLIKSATWGTGDWGLNDLGDQVLLLGPDDASVDVVVYGSASYPGVIAHPGVSLYTHSLERYPATHDTQDCAADFRDRYPPTPGIISP